MSKFIVFLLILSFAISCNREDEVRQYVETEADPPVSDTVTNKKAGQTVPELNWEIPRGWTEKKGTGLRLATLVIGGEKNQAVCTVVGLTGDGGGIEANIKRWMGQLSISSKLDSEKELARFLSRQNKIKTSGELSGLFIDFTDLDRSPDSLSMLVTVFRLPDKTIFVKMMDKKAVLSRHRDRYLSFIRSFEVSKGNDIEKN
ncbi:MAG: hypothetical protein KAS65_11380 [Candidatus Aminicenantes bacterium]|nr:hypothetical protein [Candidatus Aminicenantes bacterium]